MATLAHSAATAGIDGVASQPRTQGATPAPIVAGRLDALVVRIAMNDRILAESDVVFRESDSAWFIPDALLSGAGVTSGDASEQIDGVVYRRLQAAPGLSFNYDPSAASLSLAVAPQYFAAQQVVARKAPPRLAEGKTVPAAFFDYDAGTQYATGEFALDGAASVGVSGSFGLAQSQWAFSSVGDGSFVRLGSSLTMDDPDRHTTLVFGDGVEASTPGMAPLGFGGVAWFSNFEIDPEFIALPLPSVRGVAYAPGEVNVFVNDQKSFSGKIDEGDFLVSDLPASAGAAELKVVTTDLTGRKASFVEPYYVAPDLLRSGLSAYALAAGWDRLDSGGDGIDYGSAFARAGYRYGFSDWLTMNAAGEVNGAIADMALGADVRLGAVGAASFGIGASHASDGGGRGYSLRGAVSRSAGDFSFGLGGYYTSREFSQIGITSDIPQKMRYDGHASLRVAGGALSAAASFMDRWGAEGVRLARLQFTRDLGPGQITLAGSHIASEGEASEFRASYTLPLGGGGYASSKIVRESDGAIAGGLAAGRSPPAGEGLGYGVNIDASGEGVDARARFSLRERALEASLEGARRNGRTGVRARMRGGVILADGGLFATRQAGRGALLVETPELGETTVYLDNHAYGRTRKDGRALLSAEPFTPHSVAFDESGLPIDVALKKSSAKIATGRGRVTKVRFSTAQNFAQTVIIALPDGGKPPRGTPIVADGDPEPLPVGYDGIAYLTSGAPRRAFALVTDRGRCALEVDFKALKSRKSEDSALPLIVCAGEWGDNFVGNDLDVEPTAPSPLRSFAPRKVLASAEAPKKAMPPALRPGPGAWSGFRLTRAWRHARMAVVVLADGREPRRGTQILVNGAAQKHSVAHDGLAFLTSGERHKRYSLSTEKGACAFDVYFDNLRSGEEGDAVWPVYICR